MTKKKTKKPSSKRLFLSNNKRVVLLIIAFVLLGIWLLTSVSQHRSSQITGSQTSSYRDKYSPDKDIDINSTLGYNPPPGWTNLSDNNYSIILRNGEIKTSGNGPSFLDGADIVVYVHRNTSNLNAEEILNDYAKNNFQNTPNTHDISRNGLSGAYQKIYFDGSTDYYIFANKDYFWTISFNCKASCPKGLISDRDTFLDSLLAK